MIKKYVSDAWEEIDTLKKYDGSAWADCDSAKKYNATTQAWEDVWTNVKDLDKSTWTITYGTAWVLRSGSKGFYLYNGYDSIQCFEAHVEGVFVDPVVEITVSGMSYATGTSELTVGSINILLGDEQININANLSGDISETKTISRSGTYYKFGVFVAIYGANGYAGNIVSVSSLKINGQNYNIAAALQKSIT